MQKITFTLCSNNYLAQAKTLGDSLIYYNPSIKFIIGLVDRLHDELDYSFFKPHEILEVNEIGIPENEDLIRKYSIVEYNTAVKPFYFEYIFKNYDCDAVVYFDPDIKIFHDLKFLDKILQSYDFVLTPHLLNPDPYHIPEKEQLVLNVGAYNLGFLGLKNSDQVMLFLKYFIHRMREKCFIDFCNGLFVDQIWANLIPCYFNKVYIWKDYGCNVGYWNFDERHLSMANNRYYINETYPLIFFHISNYDPLKPKKLCRWLSYSFEARKDLIPLYDEYRQDLLRNKYTDFYNLQPLLTFKISHPTFNKREYNEWNKMGLRFKNLSRKIAKAVFNV